MSSKQPQSFKKSNKKLTDLAPHGANEKSAQNVKGGAGGGSVSVPPPPRRR